MVEKTEFEAALIEELSLVLDAPVKLASDLPGSCGLDSFGIMQVIVFLEDNYDMEVPEERFDINQFATAKTIVQWAFPMLSR